MSNTIDRNEQHTNISEAQLLANRNNAQKSTGPTSSAGREASSRNALKHRLTARISLLIGDDREDYEDLLASHVARHAPANDEEAELVQSIADNAWRILKFPEREAAIYEVGRLHNPGLYLNEIDDMVRRNAMADAQIAMLYEKDFRNLYLQERRIHNQQKAALARLKELQLERLERAKRQAAQAAEENIRQVKRAETIEWKCRLNKTPFEPSQFGFDFSLSEWTHYSTLHRTHFRLCNEFLDLKKVIADLRKGI